MKPIVFAVLCLLSVTSLAQQPETPPAAHAEGLSAESSTRALAPWSAVGTWNCTHPAWTDTITILSDGTFFRGDHGDAGRWTLSGFQNQVVLMLAWDGWSPETATMIGPDEFRGKVHTETHEGEIVMRRVQPPGTTRVEVPTKPVSDEPVKILAASYSFGSQYVDVTKRVKELLREGTTFQANPQCLLVDPQPGWNKALVIFCEVQGKRAIFSVGEGEDVSRHLLLKNARVVTGETISEGKNSYPVDIRLSGSQNPSAPAWANRRSSNGGNAF